MVRKWNKKLLVLLVLAIAAAVVFRLWPEAQPEAYRMESVAPEVSSQVVAFVDSAYRYYRQGKPDREKRMLRESVGIGDENLARDFFAEFAAIDEPDFTGAAVTSPVSRPGTYRVDFSDRNGKMCIVAEYANGRLYLVECRRQQP